ncbi:hypothetical protein VTN00DRAFT_1520 [Thermoascus crustaceus]|uniref:uncharacterized protein n=1 Tax=Thermoascus crustaceus TaxID=5088 RepID=UPI0037445C21
MASEEEFLKWGQQPFDLFLLKRWNKDSPESYRQQASRLAMEYVQMGVQGREPYRLAIQNKQLASPTPDEIETIPKPFQTDQERECLLSDPSLYNYGSCEWHKIFEPLPQLIIPHSPAGHYLQGLREARNEAIREFEDDEVDEIDYVPVYTAAVVNWIFIEDEQTLFGGEDGNGNGYGTLRVVFFDDCGRVVWEEWRAIADADFCGLYFDGSIWDWFAEGFDERLLGQSYREDGVCGPPYRREG